MAGRVPPALLEEIRRAAGGCAGPAGPDDCVGGVGAAVVAYPCDTAQVAAVMGVAAANRLTVVPRGSATKLDWGAPPSSVDLIVDTGRMTSVLDHAAGDLVVHVQAGVALADLQAVLAGAGQRLGLDPVVGPRPVEAGGAGSGPAPVAGCGTVGGTVATAASGPLRLSHGAVRDLLIGVTLVRADGVVARAGGRVVKNVAGYDLGKLITGSWGTLGIVTEAIFRLHPLPAARRWATQRVSSPDAAHRVLQAVIHSQLAPTAVELDWRAGEGTVGVLLEGTDAGVEARSAQLCELLGSGHGERAALAEVPPSWWGRPPWGAGGTALRCTHEIAGLAELLRAVEAPSAGPDGVAPVGATVRGAVAVGSVLVGIPAAVPAAAVAGLVQALRSRCGAWGGDVVVLDAPGAVREAVECWGPVRGLELMRRVKQRFDPGYLMAPGRFVGGI